MTGIILFSLKQVLVKQALLFFIALPLILYAWLPEYVFIITSSFAKELYCGRQADYYGHGVVCKKITSSEK